MPNILEKKEPVLRAEDVFLKRIPEAVYQQMVNMFANQYHFKNGERMRIANYFVGISSALSADFVQFIKKMTDGLTNNQFPVLPTPNGFKPPLENLLPTEQKDGYSFGSFDMAVTENGLRNIEFQSVATYPISAAKLNKCLLDNMAFKHATIFAGNAKTSWNDFINFYETIIAGDETTGIVLTDRKIAQQKTNFEFYATQKELNISVEIVDMEQLFEKDGALFYLNPSDKTPIKVTRLYNRILLAEALFEDNYPEDAEMWKFRFDKTYNSLKFINHPIKQYEVSKRLSPYINHPFNPECFELSTAAPLFRAGTLKYEDYVWKHKWGAAGHRLILMPNSTILADLAGELEDYIAQKKVNFKIFKTDDGQEKIVELRFMTAIQNQKMMIIPMARIGHITETLNGEQHFKIHFGDNNKEGYGFSPVVIFDETPNLSKSHNTHM